jgi:hypothetical protein
MPSPFPGMDPYLEAPRLWPDVHHSLISGIRQQLNPQLRPKYVARIEERVYISDETDPGRKAIIPDLHLVAVDPRGAAVASSNQSSQGETAQAVEVVELIEQEIHEPRIEILDADSRHVVTVIEVLSPTNKIRGSEGRREYMKKRRSVIASPTHLVEIDLLRDGAPVFVGQELPPHEYGVYVSRASDDARRGLFWPIQLSQKLPEIAIPLRAGDSDVRLNLQSVLDSQYADAGYDVDIDYGKNPEIALTAAAARWTDDLLRAKGLR